MKSPKGLEKFKILGACPNKIKITKITKSRSNQMMPHQINQKSKSKKYSERKEY